jgi:hypothetical protein
MKANEVKAHMFVEGTEINIDGFQFWIGKIAKDFFFTVTYDEDQFFFVMECTRYIPYGQRYIRRIDEGYFAIASIGEWLTFFENGDYTIDPRHKGEDDYDAETFDD